MHACRQLAPLALALLGLSACGSNPSFEMRWQIADDLESYDDASAPESIAQCTAEGLGGVRITTTQQGITVDEREYDCYASGAVAGPELSPGSYLVEVTGLRRNGTEWACVVPSDTLSNDTCEGALGCECSNDLDCDEGLNCAIIEGSNEFGEGDGDGGGTNEAPFIRVCHPCSARHLQSIDVAEDSLLSLESVLISPPQCDDGIDNDLDGLTDLLDPACARDPLANEDADSADTVVNLSVSFLNDNPNANCDIEALDAFPLDVIAFRSVIKSGVEEVDARVLTCQRDLAVYSLTLDPGDYTLELSGYAVNPDVEESAEPVTLTKTVDFIVSESNGGFVGAAFDFAGEDFIPALTGSLGFSSLFEIGGGLDNTGINRGCASGGSNDSSPLNIEELAVTVTDADGMPVDPSTLGLMGTIDGDAAVVTCPTQGSGAVVTSELGWGAYRVEVEGRVGGVACFSESLAPLPGKQLTQPISRILVDGVPPEGCADCQEDADCPSLFGNCIEGICTANG